MKRTIFSLCIALLSLNAAAKSSWPYPSGQLTCQGESNHGKIWIRFQDIRNFYPIPYTADVLNATVLTVDDEIIYSPRVNPLWRGGFFDVWEMRSTEEHPIMGDVPEWFIFRNEVRGPGEHSFYTFENYRAKKPLNGVRKFVFRAVTSDFKSAKAKLKLLLERKGYSDEIEASLTCKISAKKVTKE